MAQRRPYVDYKRKEHDYKTVGFFVPTYAEVKKRMAEFLNKSADNKASVYRQRRGEWGEWFEHWEFNSKRKPVIVKEGWC